MGLSGFGAIYIEDAATPQAITNGEWSKLLNFGFNGPSKNTVQDYANSKITVEKPGIYEITGYFSLEYPTANIVIEVHAAINGTPINPGIHQKITSVNSDVSTSFGVLAELSVDDVVEVYVKPDETSNDLTVVEASLIVKRID